VDLNQVIRETLEATESTWRHEPRSRGAEIEVTTSLAAPLPEISGDPADLREALTNLILNALDAMPRGGRLSLSTALVGNRVEVAVADTGVGIPEGIREKIFDPFFTTKGPKGTGLGLSMTYGILSRHGARVSVESQEGRGATFRLSFPLVEGVEAPGGAAAPLPVPAAPLRCLVVDDEEAVAEVLSDMLLSTGHSPAVATSGTEAVERLRREPFDVVLTDLAMPGMTGWEVARAAKGVAPAVRVVLVSGFGVEVPVEEMHAHGVDLVLAKPIRIEDLAGALAASRRAADA
jgi:CheY-like chemotaxis protein